MRKLTLVAHATALAALFLVPAAQEAIAGVTPAASGAKASASQKTEIIGVQWRHGWGWRGGWRPGWRWRPGWGWGPWPYAAGAYYASGPYYYRPYPYYYEPGPYYAPPPCCNGPRLYAPLPYEPLK